MEKWKTINSNYIIQRPWATLRVDKLEMPNGNIKEEYYVLEYPTWVNMVALTEDNQIIFVKQYRHGAGQIMVQLPAGFVEENEDPEIAVATVIFQGGSGGNAGPMVRDIMAEYLGLNSSNIDDSLPYDSHITK